MKKKLYSVFVMVLSLVLSLSLLSGCGGKDNSGDQSDAGDTGDALTMEIAGDAWEVDGIVYHFFEDGIGSTDNGYIFYYTWDGSSGVVTAEDESVSLEIIYDEDGFFMEGEDEQFYELTYAGEADTDLLADGENSGGDTIDLVGTAWEVADGEFQFHFFTNGDAATNDGGLLSYTWDGSSGEISGGGVSLGMVYDEDGFFIEGNDGIYHEFVDIGEADINLLVENGYYDDDDDDDGGGELAGAYDNDDEEMSIVFYSDGTVVMSDFEFSDEGTYTVDGDYILMEFEGQFPYEAYYDSSDDSFQVDGLDGWFYYVDEAWYTP